jgi:hypothetical protein
VEVRKADLEDVFLDVMSAGYAGRAGAVPAPSNESAPGRASGSLEAADAEAPSP